MKVAIILTVAVLLLAQNTQAGWWRRAGPVIGRVVRTASDVIRNPARIVPSILGRRNVDNEAFFADNMLTPDEVAQLLDLDETDLAEFFAQFDTNGDGVLVEDEFKEFVDLMTFVNNMEE